MFAEELKELSISGGGSLVKKVVRSQIDPGTKVLFVGLGGMGCKTVNAIKKVYTTEFENRQNVAFLAVDTDSKAMRDLNVTTSQTGYLTHGEMFEVFDDSARNLLIERPPLVRQWMSEDVPSRVLTGDGARAVRAVGRIMLCGTDKYEALRTTISGKIDDLAGTTNAGKVHVVIVAGISGGTGSGSFIDVSYMVRMLIKEKTNTLAIKCESFGIFFTPDAQESVPEISGDPATWQNLQRNGYAAMKELDYFMNLGKNDGDKTVYTIQTPTNTYTSSQTIFERSNVFFVSRTARINRCEDIIASTASSLLNMFRTGQINADGSQSVLSSLCNADGQRATWANNNVSTKADNNLPQDPSGIRNTAFPAFMNFTYSSFGYKSIYFPRNEMVAYCANEAFTRVYGVWKRAFSFTENHIISYAMQFGIDCAEHIYENAIKAINVDFSRLRVKPDDPSYPIRKGTQFLGRMEGLDDTINASKEAADSLFRAVALSTAITDPIKKAIQGAILDNADFLLNYGPYGGIVVLSGDKAKAGGGLLGLLKQIENNYQMTYNAIVKEYNEAANLLNTAKNTLANDSNPHDDEIEVFVDACEAFAKAHFKVQFYQQHMPSIITQIQADLQRLNNEFFNIYVPIMDTVKDILEEDSVIFAESTLAQNEQQTSYSLNAFNLDNALAMNDMFRRVFAGYVDDNMVKNVAQQFTQSLFSLESRKKWRNITNANQADNGILCDEIRSIFKTVTDPLISNMLEKFIVLVYGSRDSIVQANNGNPVTDINALNAIWDNDQLRDNALRSAADHIVNVLLSGAMISFDIPVDQIGNFSQSASVILLAETPNLNQHILGTLNARMGNRYSSTTIGNNATCEYKTEISMAMMISPFALPLVSKMQSYAQAYFHSEKNKEAAAGRHLDEVTERWQDTLPELYGMDAEKYYADFWQRTNASIPDQYRATDSDGQPKNTDLKMYSYIKEMVKRAIQGNYICLDDNDEFYHMLLVTPNDEEQFVQALFEKKKSNTTFVQALTEICQENEIPIEFYIFSELSNNAPLMCRQTALTQNRDPENLFRLIRSNIQSFDMLQRMDRLYRSFQSYQP